MVMKTTLQKPVTEYMTIHDIQQMLATVSPMMTQIFRVNLCMQLPKTAIPAEYETRQRASTIPRYSLLTPKVELMSDLEYAQPSLMAWRAAQTMKVSKKMKRWQRLQPIININSTKKRSSFQLQILLLQHQLTHQRGFQNVTIVSPQFKSRYELHIIKNYKYSKRGRYMTDRKLQQCTFLLQDCLSAIAGPLKTLTSFVSSEREILQKTFDASLPSIMSIIQEETEREGEEEYSNRKITEVQVKFNKHVGELIQANKQIDEIVNFYKAQMQEMAKELVKQAQKIRKISEQREKEDGKSSRRKKSQNVKPSQEKKVEEQELKARPAPSPFPEGGCQNCLTQGQRIQALEKERTTWKTLSAKIDECKKKISAYENQLKDKDGQLETLRGKLVVDSGSREKSDRDEEEKKRLKKDNTTMRGEKVLLNNQLATVRRQLAQKTSIIEAQESELLRMRLEVENLNKSLNWHSLNLNEFRAGVTKERNIEWKETFDRIDNLTRVNQALIKALGEQEQTMMDINEKSKQVEEGWKRQNEHRDKKISQLQSILEDKNETIIKLKTGGKIEKGGDRGSGYHADMVRVLNKRLTQREERVRMLQDALARVSE